MTCEKSFEVRLKRIGVCNETYIFFWKTNAVNNLPGKNFLRNSFISILFRIHNDRTTQVTKMRNDTLDV